MIPLWLLFLLVGAAGGFTAGLFGVGGGLVIVPTLYWLWREDPLLGSHVMHFAVATSLACIVVTSITSSWTHWRAGRLHFDRAPWLLAAVSTGALSAVVLARWMSTEWLKMAFGLFALMTGFIMWRQSAQPAKRPRPSSFELVVVAALIGNVSTLLGVSGGALTVPYFVLRGSDVRKAVVISSALAIPISTIGAIGMGITGASTSVTWGYVHGSAFVGISLVSLFFANWGARISQRMDKRRLQQAFAGFLALVAAHMLFF
ncbi:sulfite exporter TauE/SafE family protein [Rhodoferax sp.]|uniref:sulfite exporter TauE/SafE family protein n=1 Tax=Rhodoferax sp. TaxID=50421 RepID=UPI0025E3B714|nr:sulfite exporter TauE/SafE family protein [Rhodoferax sp.]